MDDIYRNIEEYNPDEKKKLIVLDDMITDILQNKRLNSIVTGLFISVRKLNSYLVFITQSHFAVSTNVRLKSKSYFIMKIPNK